MKRILIIFMILALIAPGCSFLGGKEQKGPEQPKAGQNDAKQDEPQKEAKKDYYIGLDAPVKGLKEWVERYKRYDVILMQKMDGYRAVLVSQGEKFAEGYDVDLGRVTQKDEKWVVEVTYKQPAEEDYAGQPVYPYEVISIRDDGKPVEVVRTGGPDTAPPSIRIEEIPEGRQLGVSKNFIVFTPLEGDKVANPVTIRGKGRVFEATFRITIEDGHNRLASKPMMTDAGAPAWGNFEISLPFARPTNPAGSVIFSYENMENGKLIEELILPVKF